MAGHIIHIHDITRSDRSTWKSRRERERDAIRHFISVMRKLRSAALEQSTETAPISA